MSEQSSHNVWLFLESVARRRGLIFTIVILATLAAVVVSLLLPKWYSATALLLPAPEQPGGSGLAELTQVALFTRDAHFPGMITTNDIYARMLKSRRILDKVIEQFDLKTRYGTTNMTGTYEALQNRATVRVTDEGMLSISVEDRDPRIAADMATAFVEQLVLLNRELLSATATENREFIQERLNDVTAQLDSARTQLEEFQVANRAVSFDDQTRLALDRAVGLKIAQASLELEIEMSEEVMGKDNPDLVAMKKRLSIINDQLDRLEWGGGDSSFFSLPVSAVPSLRGKYESLYTRVKVHESLYQTLLDLLEKARIQEKERSPSIAVLDWPTVPDLRSRPQRSLIVAATFGCALIFAFLLAVLLEYLRRMRENRVEDYHRLLFFVNAFFGWIPGVKKPAGKK